MPREAAAVSPYNHALCHCMQNHTYKVHAYLAVTCHLQFWQNGWDLLCPTVVTQGWNGYQNKSQHRKLTLEKKILPLLMQGFEHATFWSQVWCSNHWAIPAPEVIWQQKHVCAVSLPNLPGKMDTLCWSLSGVWPSRFGGGANLWAYCSSYRGEKRTKWKLLNTTHVQLIIPLWPV